MQSPRREPIGELLGAPGLGDVQEGVVCHREGDGLLAQLLGQPGMAIEVDLEAKWRPGRHAQIAQAEVLVDEVEVVMQALA